MIQDGTSEIGTAFIQLNVGSIPETFFNEGVVEIDSLDGGPKIDVLLHISKGRVIFFRQTCLRYSYPSSKALIYKSKLIKDCRSNVIDPSAFLILEIGGFAGFVGNVLVAQLIRKMIIKPANRIFVNLIHFFLVTDFLGLANGFLNDGGHEGENMELFVHTKKGAEAPQVTRGWC
jgi:hypothetical protein